MDMEFGDKLNFKVQGGTTKETDLCKSCVSGMIRRGVRSKDDLRYCRRLESTIKGNIAECSMYYPSNLPSLYDLKEAAWEITVKGNKIGFITPEERKVRDRD